MVDKRRREDSRDRKIPWLADGKPTGAGNDSQKDSPHKWKKRTRQEEGRKTEKEIAKKRGARVHPASGALRIKNDASDNERLYEIKDANKTYTIKGSEVLALWKRAMVELKEPLFVVYFTDADLTVTMTITKGKK